MKLPELERPQQYQGLYVLASGDYTGVGFTAEEVAELLESERFREAHVYKIHRARPNGELELRGVPVETFQLEAGLFFYTEDETAARGNYQGLVRLAVTNRPPCRAKVHLARWDDSRFVTAAIYPAEYDDEVGRWLMAGRYQAAGLAEGGVGAVQQYYDRAPEVLERHQVFGESLYESRTGDELLLGLRRAVQR